MHRCVYTADPSHEAGSVGLALAIMGWTLPWACGPVMGPRRCINPVCCMPAAAAVLRAVTACQAVGFAAWACVKTGWLGMLH